MTAPTPPPMSDPITPTGGEPPGLPERLHHKAVAALLIDGDQTFLIRPGEGTSLGSRTRLFASLIGKTRKKATP